jgi:hypothetical protein
MAVWLKATSTHAAKTKQMTELRDLPKEILAKCCPESHRNILSLALDPEAYAHCNTSRTHVVVCNHARMIGWTKNNILNAHLILPRAFNDAQMVGMTNRLVGLTLIDPTTLPSLRPFSRLETLTMASPPDGPRPPKRNLSAICPPSVRELNLIRAPGVEVDELPEACTHLSITRPDNNINVWAIRGLSQVTELRLDRCKLDHKDLIGILILCPMLKTLQLPNNQPGMLEGLKVAMRQGRAMPPLRSFDASYMDLTNDVSDGSWIGSVVEAFPYLEKLKLNVSCVPYELLGLPSLTCLSIHLTKGLTVAKVAPMLQILPTLERLEVIVNRDDDVEAAESLLRTVARSVKVQSREEAKHSASLSMLNVGNLLDSLRHCPNW